MAGDAQRAFLDAEVLARLSRLAINACHPMLGDVAGPHRSATRGASVEFAEYRKYVPGDDVKHVDWRVYARSDRFYMKEFEADTNLRCALVLDATGSMAYAGRHGRKLDYALRLAATLAHLLVHQGDAVGLTVIWNPPAVAVPPPASTAPKVPFGWVTVTSGSDDDSTPVTPAASTPPTFAMVIDSVAGEPSGIGDGTEVCES